MYGICCARSQISEDKIISLQNITSFTEREEALNRIPYGALLKIDETQPSRASGAGQFIKEDNGIILPFGETRSPDLSWPPPLPTHPPSITDKPWWTNPGGSGSGVTTSRPQTTTRWTHVIPGYPHWRPSTTTTTTTTTTTPPRLPSNPWWQPTTSRPGMSISYVNKHILSM